MIIIKMGDTFVREVFIYPDGTDAVVSIDREVCGEQVFVHEDAVDINLMDDADIDLLNNSVAFTSEFGTLRRTK